MKKYNIGDVRDIKSMEDLRYHQLRLELATEFLEDKIGDNLKAVKYQLSPRQLFFTLLTSVWGWVGSRTQDNDTEGPNTYKSDMPEENDF